MNRMELVKNSTIALSSVFIISSVAPSFADAATAYKVKSGKLVTAKTNKKVKGLKLYKSILYKNGVKVKGYTLYKSTLYYNGKKKSGNKVYKSTLYVNGKKSKGYKVVSSTLYNNGKKTKGYKAYKNKLYYNGKLKSGYKTNASILYYNGVKFTGTYSSKYHKTGKVFTGFRTISGVKYYYKSGKKLTGLYQNSLYVSGVVNKGQYVFSNTLYNGATVDSRTIVYKSKLYSAGKLATGSFVMDGKIVEYVNGVVKPATTPVVDEPSPPAEDIDKLTEEKLILLIKEYSVTKVNTENAAYITALLASYEKLSDEQKKGLEDKMKALQASLDEFKASISLSVSQINDKPIYTVINTSNVEEIRILIAAYNALTEVEKKSVTYPIIELQQIYTVYSIEKSGITIVNSANIKKATELLEMYKTLTAENQAKLEATIKELQRLVNVYMETNKTDFTVITNINIGMAELALADFDNLTKAQQDALPYTKIELQNKITAYKFDFSSRVFVTINSTSDLATAQAILNEYKQLSSAIKQYLKYNITELETLINVYNFNITVQNLNVENANDANEFIKFYLALLPEARAKLDPVFKVKYENAVLTRDVSELRTLLSSVKDVAEINAGNVDVAKDGIAAYQAAKPAVIAKLGYSIDSLKQKVATYDLDVYFTKVVNPAYLKGVYNVSGWNGNVEMIHTEVPYLLNMLAASDITKSDKHGYKIHAIVVLANGTISPNLKIDVKAVGSKLQYSVIPFDKKLFEKYGDVTYNYEKEFKNKKSLLITTK